MSILKRANRESGTTGGEKSHHEGRYCEISDHKGQGEDPKTTREKTSWVPFKGSRIKMTLDFLKQH